MSTEHAIKLQTSNHVIIGNVDISIDSQCGIYGEGASTSLTITKCSVHQMSKAHFRFRKLFLRDVSFLGTSVLVCSTNSSGVLFFIWKKMKGSERKNGLEVYYIYLLLAIYGRYGTDVRMKRRVNGRIYGRNRRILTDVIYGRSDEKTG